MDEENPALGWRALRLSLDRPALFRMQVRAMLKAADGRPLRIMLPMAATVGELRSARAMIDRELAHLARHKYPVPQPLEVGAMIEVPSLVYQLESVCREVDFLSIGSNDLMQYFFAADRGNPRMMSRYDVLSTPVLRLLKHIVETAQKHNTPLALCGEMGSKPTEVMALLAIGLRTLSMSPAAIGPVKAMILSLDLARLQKGLLEHLQDDDFAVRAYLEEFAANHHIQLR
jgi:phosphotransferase system enzyme I (PtsP)